MRLCNIKVENSIYCSFDERHINPFGDVMRKSLVRYTVTELHIEEAETKRPWRMQQN